MLFEFDYVDSVEMEVLCCVIVLQFDQYVKLNKKILLEIFMLLLGIDEVGCFVDMIVECLLLKFDQKQYIFEMFLVIECFEYLFV